MIKLSESAYSKKFANLIKSHDRYLIAYGGRGCFNSNQKVQSSKGLISISSVNVGDDILSYNHSNNKPEFKKVVNTFKYKNKDKCVKIVLKNSIIICTLDHKFYYKGEYLAIEKILEINGININKRS